MVPGSQAVRSEQTSEMNLLSRTAEVPFQLTSGASPPTPLLPPTIGVESQSPILALEAEPTM